MLLDWWLGFLRSGIRWEWTRGLRVGFYSWSSSENLVGDVGGFGAVGTRMKTYGSFTIDQVRMRNVHSGQGIDTGGAIDIGGSEIDFVVVLEGN